MADLQAINELLAEKIRLKKKIGRLEKKERKRKRAKREKKTKHGKPKSRPLKKRPKVSSLAVDSAGRTNKGNILTVRNPRTGALITINPAPGKRNRAFKKIVEDARRVNWRNGNIHTESLVLILAELFKLEDGPRCFSYDFIPEKVGFDRRLHPPVGG